MPNENEQLMAYFEAETRPRRWRFVRWLLFLAALMVVLLLAAPTIVTRTSLKDHLISKFLPAEIATVSMRDLSIGWFSPLRVQDLRIVDGQNEPLLEVAEISGDRTLVDFAKNYSDIGTVVVTSPVAHLTLRPDGSNLEDTINKLMEEYPSDASAAEPTAIAANLKLVDGKVIAFEQASGQTWQLEQLYTVATMPASLDANWVVEASGQLEGSPFAASMQTALGKATDVWPLGPEGTATVQTNALPLAPLRYAALRSGQPIDQLVGTLSSNIGAQWVPEANAAIPRLDAAGAVRVDNLGDDRTGIDWRRHASNCKPFRLDTKASISNDIVNLQQCNLQSDFGNVGVVTVANLNHLSDPNAIVDAIRRQQLQTQGQIDLAALARTLPKTLKIRDDIQIGSGKLAWNVQSQVDAAAGTRWTGELHTADVRILRDGQAIDWQFPLEVNFVATRRQRDRARESHGPLRLLFHGRHRHPSSGTAFRRRADLERLVFQLSQVIDTNNMYVRGQMDSFVQWNETQPNQLGLDARTKLTQFEMRQNEQLVCKEDELTMMVVGKGKLNGQQLESVDEMRLDVVSAGDFLVAQLTQPISNPGANSTLPLSCRLQGEIGSWLARLKPLGGRHGH